VAKLLSALLLAAGIIFLIMGALLASTTRSLDLQVLDIYLVILPRYLFLAGSALLFAAFLVWKHWF
jgi:hypothetical protein